MDHLCHGALSRGLQVIFIANLIVGMVACGGSSEEVDVKEYRISVSDQRPDVQSAFSYLVDSFNNDVGFDALTLAQEDDAANSFVTVTKGLEERDGKVGWGQWIRVTEVEGGASGFIGGGGRKVYRYSMKLEFDEEYISTRWSSRSDSDEYELRKLFYHEVGHGLQMNHVTDSSDIMYYDISGQKSFSVFYRNVRNYFSGQ